MFACSIRRNKRLASPSWMAWLTTTFLLGFLLRVRLGVRFSKRRNGGRWCIGAGALQRSCQSLLKREQSERDKLWTLAGELPSFLLAELIVQQLVEEADVDCRRSNGGGSWLIYSQSKNRFPTFSQERFQQAE